MSALSSSNSPHHLILLRNRKEEEKNSRIKTPIPTTSPVPIIHTLPIGPIHTVFISAALHAVRAGTVRVRVGDAVPVRADPGVLARAVVVVVLAVAAFLADVPRVGTRF